MYVQRVEDNNNKSCVLCAHCAFTPHYSVFLTYACIHTCELAVWDLLIQFPAFCDSAHVFVMTMRSRPCTQHVLFPNRGSRVVHKHKQWMENHHSETFDIHKCLIWKYMFYLKGGGYMGSASSFLWEHRSIVQTLMCTQVLKNKKEHIFSSRLYIQGNSYWLWCWE